MNTLILLYHDIERIPSEKLSFLWYTYYMKFHRDILIIDFEQAKGFPVQVGALLLDKETLEEKHSFLSYIYAEIGEYINPKTGITQEMIIDALNQKEVGEKIYAKFGSDIFLSSFAQNMDIGFFTEIMQKAGIDFIGGRTDFQKYDYHIIDIWPLAYIHALKNGYTGTIRSEELFQFYGAKPRDLHNALEDCRLAGEVLRNIMK